MVEGNIKSDKELSWFKIYFQNVLKNASILKGEFDTPFKTVPIKMVQSHKISSSSNCPLTNSDLAFLKFALCKIQENEKRKNWYNYNGCKFWHFIFHVKKHLLLCM